MRRHLYIVFILTLMLPGISVLAAPVAEPAVTTVYLPLIGTGDPRIRVGYDLRISYGAQAETLLSEIPASWARAGDLIWAAIEPTRGVYQWDAAHALDANIRRLRAANIEPVVMVQIAPAWARTLPNRQCSPVAPAAYDDLARFAQALATRYRSGELAVRYWQFWNEPDFTTAIDDHLGSGCWNTGKAPWYGGDAYGAALRVFSNAVRAVNPSAQIIGGNFAHPWPDDQQTIGFLRGMIESGGISADMIGFSGYTRWGTAERMTLKTQKLRAVLAEYELENMSLAAVEVGEVWSASQVSGFDFYQTQSHYAARIYAMALALDLRGVMWHTLLTEGVGFEQSHLVDVTAAKVTPRPAFYAYRNAALLLQGASYAGPALTNVRFDEYGKVQVLPFRTNAGRWLYVVWLPNVNEARQFALPVWRGARAACITGLDRPTPLTADCSDTRNNGVIPLTVSDAPIYVRLEP